MKQFDWRAALARIPLPMLALAASYGVWGFNRLFVPDWVALISAAAFELTYVGLAVARVVDGQRTRASVIAASAVAVSVLYNVASGLFHRRPDLLINPPLWADVGLALMHGLPLAIVAYNVAALLLHSADVMPADGLPDAVYARPSEPMPAYPVPMPAHDEASQVIGATTGASRYYCPNCSHELSLGQFGSAKRYGHCGHCKP